MGNAKSMGMSAELHLSAHQYSNLASAFLIGYILFQLPGTIFLRKIGAPLQLAIAMVCVRLDPFLHSLQALTLS